MTQTTQDRVWAAIDRLTEATQQNTTAIAVLTESAKRTEANPQNVAEIAALTEAVRSQQEQIGALLPNTSAIAGIVEAMKAQGDRIDRVEQHPTVFREWLSTGINLMMFVVALIAVWGATHP